MSVNAYDALLLIVAATQQRIARDALILDIGTRVVEAIERGHDTVTVRVEAATPSTPPKPGPPQPPHDPFWSRRHA